LPSRRHLTLRVSLAMAKKKSHTHLKLYELKEANRPSANFL
jgi:hypothetical protein